MEVKTPRVPEPMQEEVRRAETFCQDFEWLKFSDDERILVKVLYRMAKNCSAMAMHIKGHTELHVMASDEVRQAIVFMDHFEVDT